MRKMFGPRYPIIGTALGTHSTTTIQDTTALAYASAAISLFDGQYIHVVTSAGASKGVSRITRGGLNVNGTLTVSPAFTGGAPVNTDMYEIYYDGFHRDHFNEGITRLLRKTFVPRFLPLSGFVTDGDMELAADVTHWVAVGVPTTREKAATNVLWGQRALHLITNTLAAGAVSDTFDVHSSETVSVWVLIKVVSGSVIVSLYDVTHGANVANQTATVSEVGWTLIHFPSAGFSSGTKQAAIRILSATAVSEWYVDTVSVRSPEIQIYNLPSSVEFPERLNNIVTFPQFSGLSQGPIGGFLSASADNSYVALSQRSKPFENWDTVRDDLGVNPNRIQLTEWCEDLLFLDFRAPLANLTDDTTTSVIDLDYAVARLMAYLTEQQAVLASSDNKGELSIRRRNDAAGLHKQANTIARKLGYSAQPYIRVLETPRVLV